MKVLFESINVYFDTFVVTCKLVLSFCSTTRFHFDESLTVKNVYKSPNWMNTYGNIVNQLLCVSRFSKVLQERPLCGYFLLLSSNYLSLDVF